MISVAEALDRLFGLITPLSTETVALRKAHGRVLAQPALAQRNQPPFATSAMDGYALRGDEAIPGAQFTVIGEAAAGTQFSGDVAPGQAVRIFTGAPVPQGADRVIMQEDVTRDGDVITLGDKLGQDLFVRPMGADFMAGMEVTAPRRLSPSDIALLAAMNISEVTVTRRPQVAIISTGDELVMPGENPGEDQIIASNSFGLAAMLEAEGCTPRILPIAADNYDALFQVFELAKGADLIVTSGGASVGDHDLVAKALQKLGATMDFHKVAMRPGKPLMAGLLNGSPMLGLPGNPVSAMVCGMVFLRPMARALQGLPAAPAPRQKAELTLDLGENGPREHYMRAILQNGQVTPLARQDSSLLTVLAEANAL
ncbi:MAG: gephyrin-like molybdotransferase Glp, partial [Mangrovicoccus sp.]